LSPEEFYAEELLAGKLSTAVKSRTPWLLVTMLGSFVAVLVGDSFSETIHMVPILAIFIPLLGGLGGNVGTQSSALMVRGLATGHVSLDRALFHVAKQCSVGLLIGLVVGVLVGSLVSIWKGNPWIGLVIGGGLWANITVAATMGTFVPLAFKRLNVDPAIASGPFITTAIDITGLSIYFGLATLSLQYLVKANM
jgi:magnesium transporter